MAWKLSFYQRRWLEILFTLILFPSQNWFLFLLPFFWVTNWSMLSVRLLSKVESKFSFSSALQTPTCIDSSIIMPFCYASATYRVSLAVVRILARAGQAKAPNARPNESDGYVAQAYKGTIRYLPHPNSAKWPWYPSNIRPVTWYRRLSGQYTLDFWLANCEFIKKIPLHSVCTICLQNGPASPKTSASAPKSGQVQTRFAQGYSRDLITLLGKITYFAHRPTRGS